MKKLLVVLLALAVVGGVFADVTGYGRVRTDFGVGMDLEAENESPTWVFGVSPRIGLKGEKDNVSFWVHATGTGGLNVSVDNSVITDYITNPGSGSLDGLIATDFGFGVEGDATVTLGSATLSIGKTELPWAQWSSLDFWGDSHYGFGVSASKNNPYIQFGIAGLYLGLTDGGYTNEKYLSRTDDSSYGYSAVTPFPGFYVGYDFASKDTFTAGLAFAGAPRGVIEDEISVFSFMINAHAKLLMLDPITLGINFAFYNAPQYGYFALSNSGLLYEGSIKDGAVTNTVIEGLLDIGIGLDPCNIGLSLGLLTNATSEDDGGNNALGLKIGACATFDLGGGFSLIPGVVFENWSWKDDGKSTNMSFGVSLSYNF